MHGDFISEYAGMRQQEAQEAVRISRLARVRKDRPPWRECLAGRLMDAAFAVEPEASWRAVWRRMTAPAGRGRSVAEKRRYVR